MALEPSDVGVYSAFAAAVIAVVVAVVAAAAVAAVAAAVALRTSSRPTGWAPSSCFPGEEGTACDNQTSATSACNTGPAAAAAAAAAAVPFCCCCLLQSL